MNLQELTDDIRQTDGRTDGQIPVILRGFMLVTSSWPNYWRHRNKRCRRIEVKIELLPDITAYFLDRIEQDPLRKNPLGYKHGALWGVYMIQQTSSKCIQHTRAIAGRLLDRVNTV